MIRLIALDLDGTLLNKDFELTTAVSQSIQRAQDAGIRVVVTTGRDIDSTRSFLQRLNLEQFVITSGGALVWMDGRIVAQKCFTPKQTRLILELGQQYDTGFFIDQPEMTWKFGNPYFIQKYEHVSTATSLEVVDRIFDPSPIKISLLQERESLLQLLQQLQHTCPELHTVFPFEHVVDVNPAGANKGVALTWLALQLGIPLSQVATVGDSENDISMFEVSGLSFAMGNAPEHVQRSADHVVAGNDQNGVVHAIGMALTLGHS
jgi:Cof subfamily protein (haloacid dehalogenase superfamily)